jgi:hypothetical protein
MIDIPMFPYDPDNPKNSVEGNVDIIHRRTVEMIDIGYNSGMDVVTLFEIESPHDDKERFLNLHWDRWVENLNNALEYFEEIEDYEMCSYAKDVLDRVVD